jgi:hypothetical protein
VNDAFPSGRFIAARPVPIFRDIAARKAAERAQPPAPKPVSGAASRG